MGIPLDLNTMYYAKYSSLCIVTSLTQMDVRSQDTQFMHFIVLHFMRHVTYMRKGGVL